jgi:Zn-dependent protease with chaperone function
MAQGPDDEDFPDNSGADAVASLSLTFDRQGALDVNLVLPETAPDSETLPAALAQALHCPVTALHHRDESRDLSFQKNWSEARRQRYRKEMEAFNRRQWSGHCEGALSRDGQLLRGNFDWSSVTAELRQMGADELTLSINTPKTEFREYTQENLVRTPYQPAEGVYYRIPLSADTKPPVIHFAFGFRPADLRRACAVLTAFILFPILLTLWWRHRALALAKVDPAAAWFGFFRPLNWLALGAMLVWITSGLGARQILGEWIAAQHLSDLKAAFAEVALTIAPGFLVYLICILLSYKVHAQLRGAQWTRREFVYRQLVTVGAQAVPLMFWLSGLHMVAKQQELAIGLFFFAFVAFQVMAVLKLRVMKAFPQPLTTGELRDRIFALAGRLAVPVNQIFIVPARKGQVANAFAARNKIVMFTDYLLDHLNKQEVDGVAAHELAHLRFKHPVKIGMAFLAAIFLPQYFVGLCRLLLSFAMIPLAVIPAGVPRARLMMHVYAGLNQLERWPQKDLLVLFLGMTGFYFLSRHFEYVADATAVRLTGNAEAQITGLLKISRLNLIPIRWGKASESWLTHPSTVRRVHRMAAAGGLAPLRLQQILQEYEAQSSGAKVVPAEDRYAVPSAADPERMVAAGHDHTRTQGIMWVNLAVYVVPPALVCLFIERMHLEGGRAFATHSAGIIVTSLLVTLTAVWLGEGRRERERQRLARRLENEKIAGIGDGSVLVGFAPGPFPRIYGTHYHWDTGFLVFANDRLQFVGEQVKFSFTRAEIDAVAIGPGGPSWWKFERVYVRWKTGDGRSGIFNLNSLEPGSWWRSCTRVRELYRQIDAWRRQAGRYPEVRPALTQLKTLELGQVTSISPRFFGTLRVNLRVGLYLLLLAFGVSTLTHSELGYVCLSVGIVRLIQLVPCWRYRDVLPAFSRKPNELSKAQTANAAVGAS